MDVKEKDDSFQEYLNKIKIQEVLRYAGYVQNKRDGLRYPSFVRLDSNGERIHGDKFLVNPRTNTCYHPPVYRNFNVISLITEHPELFSSNKKNPYALVHEVCKDILGKPQDERNEAINLPSRSEHKFNLNDYQLHRFNKYDWESQKKFGPFFINRGINLTTQSAFHNTFLLASKEHNDKTYTNLSFPQRVPGYDKVVGLEERGYPRMDGSSGYKGMAMGSNSAEGLWIANLSNKELSEAKHVLWFESAYDAMAFYQLHTSQESKLDNQSKEELKSAVYVSTGGNPAYGQINNMLNIAPNATHHIAFDNDLAGNQFSQNFQDIVDKRTAKTFLNVPEEMRPFISSFEHDIKSVNDMVKITDEQRELLPSNLRDLHMDYTESKKQLYNDSGWGFDGADNVDKLQKEYIKELLKQLNITHQQIEPIKVVREIPSEGNKDWNEQLLRDRDAEVEIKSETKLSGVDMDGNGTIEMSEADEKKTTTITRHR